MDFITYDAFNVFNMISQCVIKPLILLVGVPSNVVNSIVFWRQGLRDRMNLCLFCLALTDLLYLVSVFGQSVIGPFVEFGDELLGKEIYHKAVKFTKWFTLEMNTFSTCITLVVAVDRCVCVMTPLRALSLLSSRAMGGILGSIYITTQLGFSVNIFRYDVIAVKANNSSHVTGWKWTSTKTWMDNYTLFSTIQEVLLMTVLPIVIFVGISVTTALTVARLRTAMLWRKSVSSSSNSSQQVALTKMLVVVSCVYFATSVPYVVFIVVGVAIDDFDLGGRYQNSFLVCGILVIVLSMVRSSCNIFVYFHQSSRFRRESLSLSTAIGCLRGDAPPIGLNISISTAERRKA
ncbi:uncharacterized protein LOC112565937 [Pomacea canaliculata]|uniref:uncharacterized protein LOC112565937 n=1 Tax=Pomacea canaliculata TaxID=400727 RepID=UPI000D736B43|nr:uncharacterized protein LOC112565937 [Pomacea canaliculata]